MGQRNLTEDLSDLNIATEDFMESVVSQINNDNFVSSRLLKKSKGVDGGKKISVPLKYGRENVQSMGEYDEYNLQPNEILDEAYYDWRHINGDMVLSMKKLEVQNAGKAELIDLARTKSENLAETMRANFSTLLFTSVANLTSKDPDSLIKIVGTQNNTVGGIDASAITDYTWNPFLLDYSTEGITYGNLTDPDSSYYIETLLRKIVSRLTMGSDMPTILLTTQGVWDAYEEVLRADMRIDSKYMVVDGGFETLKFRSTLVAVDNNIPGGQLNTTSNNGAMLLALNEKYLGYRHSTRVNWKWTKWKKAERQPVYFSLLDWAGAFVCSRRDRQGAVLGLPTDAQIYV